MPLGVIVFLDTDRVPVAIIALIVAPLIMAMPYVPAPVALAPSALIVEPALA